jgi:uncharacterized protein (TIGR00288 family)
MNNRINPQNNLQNSIAVFIDFENLALGFQGTKDRFEIQLVLKRILEKGRIVAKKAYCDWHRFTSHAGALHEAAIELVEIPRRHQTGKNSADMRLCVDAMDLAYSKDHIDTFVIVSGDSDFSPLVSKLKELGKQVIGIGMRGSTSNLLRDNCDEFIYYEDLARVVTRVNASVDRPILEDKKSGFLMLLEGLQAMRREDKEILLAAALKRILCRLYPGFSEAQFGYKSFSAMLEDAEKEKFLELGRDPKSGTYLITRFGDEMVAQKVEEQPPEVVVPKPIVKAAAKPVARPVRGRPRKPKPAVPT